MPKRTELFYKGQKVRIVKDLNLIDGVGGKWYQIEILDGADRGKRIPVNSIELDQ